MTEPIDAAYIHYIREQDNYWSSRRQQMDREDGIDQADDYYSMNQAEFTRYFKAHYYEELAV